MENKLTVGQFLERDSILHRLDPRTKLLGMLALMIALLTVGEWSGYAAASIAVGMLLALSRIPVRFYARGVLPILPILLFTLLYHMAFGKGDRAIFSYGLLSVTEEGTAEGVRIVWRILLMILLASLLTGTTRPLTLAQGLETLLKPLSKLRVPVEQFALMIVIAIRFIPTILEELDRIQQARRARGFEPSKRGPLGRLAAFVPVLVPLLATTVRRAENLTMAIEARAYGDGRGRTAYRPLKLRRRDWQSAAALLAMLLAIFVAERLGYPPFAA
ncbi:energy-coupling factor transporter transmembrane component T family protein [Saccharibacillus alkalitolerans]|uniref:Energy-coupling factor transporter transmembrane protein EcfT n=1 Tax=Saccharibacillus alkalitolerans TaxID=2705290 RepID=A0ABX0F290_9BACL|nr:energy-coupling factor transporter transmembrane component T [Saccharibacillus alkalitolerans]NGZ74672.1 energy-coupling factor transporter transmembrane protein EcfT [Saccharibacillus alkalitolerans]